MAHINTIYHFRHYFKYFIAFLFKNVYFILQLFVMTKYITLYGLNGIVIVLLQDIRVCKCTFVLNNEIITISF